MQSENMKKEKRQKIQRQRICQSSHEAVQQKKSLVVFKTVLILVIQKGDLTARAKGTSILSIRFTFWVIQEPHFGNKRKRIGSESIGDTQPSQHEHTIIPRTDHHNREHKIITTREH